MKKASVGICVPVGVSVFTRRVLEEIGQNIRDSFRVTWSYETDRNSEERGGYEAECDETGEELRYRVISLRCRILFSYLSEMPLIYLNYCTLKDIHWHLLYQNFKGLGQILLSVIRFRGKSQFLLEMPDFYHFCFFFKVIFFALSCRIEQMKWQILMSIESFSYL